MEQRRIALIPAYEPDEKMLALLPQLTGYELEESRIPYDDLYHSEGEMLVPDFDATISRLHETLYGAQ